MALLGSALNIHGAAKVLALKSTAALADRRLRGDFIEGIHYRRDGRRYIYFSGPLNHMIANSPADHDRWLIESFGGRRAAP
jgi:hypothetical protein